MFIATKPSTYRARVHWYVSYYYDNVIHLFRTKRDAVAFAKKSPLPTGLLSVDWFDAKAKPSFAISSKAKFIDHRKATAAYDKAYAEEVNRLGLQEML